jgi:hypothetical protein
MRETKKAAASKLFPPDLQAPETCEKTAKLCKPHLKLLVVEICFISFFD